MSSDGRNGRDRVAHDTCVTCRPSSGGIWIERLPARSFSARITLEHPAIPRLHLDCSVGGCVGVAAAAANRFLLVRSSSPARRSSRLPTTSLSPSSCRRRRRCRCPRLRQPQHQLQQHCSPSSPSKRGRCREYAGPRTRQHQSGGLTRRRLVWLPRDWPWRSPLHRGLGRSSVNRMRQRSPATDA